MILFAVSAQAKQKRGFWELRFDTVVVGDASKIEIFASGNLTIVKNNRPIEVLSEGKDRVRDLKIYIPTDRVGKMVKHDTVYNFQKNIYQDQKTKQKVERWDGVGINYIRLWVEFKLKDSEETISIPFRVVNLNGKLVFQNEQKFYDVRQDMNKPLEPNMDFYETSAPIFLMVDLEFLQGMRQTEDFNIKWFTQMNKRTR